MIGGAEIAPSEMVLFRMCASTWASWAMIVSSSFGLKRQTNGSPDRVVKVASAKEKSSATPACERLVTSTTDTDTPLFANPAQVYLGPAWYSKFARISTEPPDVNSEDRAAELPIVPALRAKHVPDGVDLF